MPFPIYCGRTFDLLVIEARDVTVENLHAVINLAKPNAEDYLTFPVSCLSLNPRAVARWKERGDILHPTAQDLRIDLEAFGEYLAIPYANEIHYRDSVIHDAAYTAGYLKRHH